MAPLNVLKKMKILVLLGLNHYPEPPLQLWGGQALDCLGPSQWAQAIWWKNGLWAIGLVPWPPEPQHIWAQVASNSPHGSRTMACGL
ncbi:hypothetical protein O181_059618 [Austropuccinia psidii MF-1]|uniref:Uncharacterized protein n=1 Tax=Austropuccinia psidii MF-1 TaxID=1389203 RepID=A0A9Q3EF48_9BASI|nr:hypothetical protein [Austropuccinia psidii MF-1]